MEEFERNVDHVGMMQPSQQHVAPYVKGVKWGKDMRGLRMVAGFWAGISVVVTQEADIVPQKMSQSGHLFSCLIQHAGKRWAYSTPRPQVEKVDSPNVDIDDINHYKHGDELVISGDIIMYGTPIENCKDIVLAYLFVY